jgi:hypothetical protein
MTFGEALSSIHEPLHGTDGSLAGYAATAPTPRSRRHQNRYPRTPTETPSRELASEITDGMSGTAPAAEIERTHCFFVGFGS